MDVRGFHAGSLRCNFNSMVFDASSLGIDTTEEDVMNAAIYILCCVLIKTSAGT